MKTAEKRYREHLARTYEYCVCGRPREQFHHIIHVNWQRITKDDMLVIGLCHQCHQGGGGVHNLGGDQKFHEATGHDLVHLATLRRHNFEVRNG